MTHRAGEWTALSYLAVALLLGCADSHDRDAALGGETHFLSCERHADCDRLGVGHVCGDDGLCEDVGAVAAEAIRRNGCEDCRDAAQDPPAMELPADETPTTVGAGTATGTVIDGSEPLVMLLVDTSGSMERIRGCACTTRGCTECLPACGGGVTPSARNRWATMLEVLTGTFDNFQCEALARTADNGMTYDLGYHVPYHRPSGTEQARDGVLDRYEGQVRFGVATFDGWGTYVGAPSLVAKSDFDREASAGPDGLWSYDADLVSSGSVSSGFNHPLGSIWYPNAGMAFYMDTGIRGPAAEEGAVRAAVAPQTALEVNAAIQNDLLGVRPYGGTPIAAALQDLEAYLGHDPDTAQERANSQRSQHVILITDGYPDDDFRDYGCDCVAEQDSADESFCGGGGNDPNDMHCPYATPEQAARNLGCSTGADCTFGPATQLHVVGLGTAIAANLDGVNIVEDQLHAIARAGGGDAAHLAETGAALREALDTIFGKILDDSNTQVK